MHNNKNKRGHLAAWFVYAIRSRSLSHTQTTLPNASYFRRYVQKNLKNIPLNLNYQNDKSQKR